MEDVPGLHMLLDAPIIDDQADAALVSETIAELARRVDSPVRLVVLDKLNRVMQGEENSAAAMEALMRGVERIRQRVGCAVTIIQHTGRGDKMRASDSSAFFAALDSEVTIKQIGTRVVELESTKSKDSEPFQPVPLKLDQVTIEGVNDHHGRVITSLVPRTMSLIEEGAALGELTDDEASLLEIVEQSGVAKPYDSYMREAFCSLHTEITPRQARRKYLGAVDGLIKKGRLYRDGKDHHGDARYKVR